MPDTPFADWPTGYPLRVGALNKIVAGKAFTRPIGRLIARQAGFRHLATFPGKALLFSWALSYSRGYEYPLIFPPKLVLFLVN